MRNLQGGCKISFVFSGFKISVTSIVFERLKKLSTDLKCHLIKYSTLNPSSFSIPQGQARGILLVCHWIPVPNWQFLKNVCSSVMVLLGQMSMFSSLKMCFLFRPSTTRRCKRCPCWTGFQTLPRPPRSKLLYPWPRPTKVCTLLKFLFWHSC